MREHAKNSPELQDNRYAEVLMTQHFALLHGILQIQEEKLLEQLHQQYKHMQDNVAHIEGQLQEHQRELFNAASVCIFKKIHHIPL